LMRRQYRRPFPVAGRQPLFISPKPTAALILTHRCTAATVWTSRRHRRAFEPGQTREGASDPLAGDRKCYGFNAEVMARRSRRFEKETPMTTTTPPL